MTVTNRRIGMVRRIRLMRNVKVLSRSGLRGYFFVMVYALMMPSGTYWNPESLLL